MGAAFLRCGERQAGKQKLVKTNLLFSCSACVGFFCTMVLLGLRVCLLKWCFSPCLLPPPVQAPSAVSHEVHDRREEAAASAERLHSA